MSHTNCRVRKRNELKYREDANLVHVKREWKFKVVHTKFKYDFTCNEIKMSYQNEPNNKMLARETIIATKLKLET